MIYGCHIKCITTMTYNLYHDYDDRKTIKDSMLLKTSFNLLDVTISMPNSNLDNFCIVIEVINVEYEFLIEHRISRVPMHCSSLVFILMTAIHRCEGTFNICVDLR